MILAFACSATQGERERGRCSCRSLGFDGLDVIMMEGLAPDVFYEKVGRRGGEAVEHSGPSRYSSHTSEICKFLRKSEIARGGKRPWDFSQESRAHHHFRLIQLPVCNESIMQLCSSAVDDVSQYPLIDFSLKYAPTPVPVRLCLACSMYELFRLLKIRV